MPICHRIHRILLASDRRSLARAESFSTNAMKFILCCAMIHGRKESPVLQEPMQRTLSYSNSGPKPQSLSDRRRKVAYSKLSCNASETPPSCTLEATSNSCSIAVTLQSSSCDLGVGLWASIAIVQSSAVPVYGPGSAMHCTKVQTLIAQLENGSQQL